MAVQTFEHLYARQFRSVPAATSLFQTRHFLLLPSLNFLTLLHHKGHAQPQGSMLELSMEDLDRFRTMQKAKNHLKVALKSSRKRGGKSDGEPESD